MKKTNLFLKQCLAIVVMVAMAFVVSCSDDTTEDVVVDDDDDTTITPDDGDDNDDDDNDNDDNNDNDDDENTPDSEVDALADFLAILDEYVEFIPTDAVAALEAADADVVANPSDIESAIAAHAAAVVAAEEGFVVTSIVNSYTTLTVNYRVDGVAGEALTLTKGDIDVAVTDETTASVITIEIEGEEYTLPKGYASNISTLTCPSSKISLTPGADATVVLTIDAEADGYINYISGFSIYSDEVAATKTELPAVSANLLRVTEVAENSTSLTLTIAVAEDAVIGWGSIAIQYGDATTDEIAVTPADQVVVESIAYGNGFSEADDYVTAEITTLAYSYNPESTTGAFNLYFTGVDNSGDEVATDVLLSEELAISSYEVKIYQIAEDAEVSGANLILGSSDSKATALSYIAAAEYLTAIETSEDYISESTSVDETIALALDLAEFSPYAGETKSYLIVVSGTTNNSSVDNCFVVSNIINVINENAATLSITPEEEAATYFSGDTFEVAVTSNTNWTATEDYDWVTISATEGTGSETITVTYDANILETSREATIVFKAGDIEKELTITQTEYFEISMEIDTTEESVTTDAGTVDVAITSNYDWTVATDATWVTLSTESGAQDGSVTISYTANTTYEKREAVITFTAGEDVETLTITQAKVIEPSSFAYASNDFDGTSADFNYILTSEKTLAEIFDVEGLTIADLTTEESITFAIDSTIFTSTGSRTEAVSVAYSVEGDKLQVKMPVSLVTFGEYTGSTVVGYGDAKATLEFDLSVNGYPVSFEYKIDEMMDNVTGALITEAEKAYYTCDEETKAITMDVSEWKSSGKVQYPLGFLQPNDDDKKYLDLVTNATSLYYEEAAFVEEVDGVLYSRGGGMNHNASNNVLFIYYSYVATGSSMLTNTVFDGSVLAGSLRDRNVQPAKVYPFYIQLRFPFADPRTEGSTQTFVWYDTGYTVTIPSW